MSIHGPTTILVHPAGVVTIALAEAIFGLTRRAIEGKIHRGDWVEGQEYHRAPDGGVWVSVEGVTRWVGAGRASRCDLTASASRTRTRAGIIPAALESIIPL